MKERSIKIVVVILTNIVIFNSLPFILEGQLKKKEGNPDIVQIQYLPDNNIGEDRTSGIVSTPYAVNVKIYDLIL